MSGQARLVIHPLRQERLMQPRLGVLEGAAMGHLDCLELLKGLQEVFQGVTRGYKGLKQGIHKEFGYAN